MNTRRRDLTCRAASVARRRTGVPLAILFVGGLVVVACTSPAEQGSATEGTEQVDSEATPTSTIASISATPESNPAVPTSDATATTATIAANGESLTMPLRGLAFDVDSEIRVASDLRRLSAGRDALFAIRPPDTLVRIDPASDETVQLELGIGPSVNDLSWAVSGDTIWLIGGAFRDELIEIDATTMTEVGRTELGDDHAVAAVTANDVWLTTLRAVRRFDIAGRALGPPIALDVDPGPLALARDGMVWVSLPTAAQVARVDPTTRQVDTFDVAPGPGWLAVDHGVVWISHPPIAAVSRLDPATGRTIDVIDLDLSHGAVASTQTGSLQTTDDGTWVYLTFPGSKFRDAVAFLDPTGTLVGARIIPFDSYTWEAVTGGVWFHRLDAGSIVHSSLADLVNGPPTEEAQLLPSLPPTSTTVLGPAVVTDEQAELVARLDQVLDPTVSAADLGIAAQSDARDELIELAAAQSDLHLEPLSVTIGEQSAVTVFDVLIAGNAVILPAVELNWHRTDDGLTWHLDTATFCRLASGVGITGCSP